MQTQEPSEVNAGLAIPMTEDLDAVVRTVVVGHQLRAIGWRGFEALPETVALIQEVPQLAELVRQASPLNLSDWRKQARDLLEAGTPALRQRLRWYFACRMALEALSAHQWGPGAGACDKRTALTELYLCALALCR